MTAKEVFSKTLQFGWIKLGLGIAQYPDSRRSVRHHDGYRRPVR